MVARHEEGRSHQPSPSSRSTRATSRRRSSTSAATATPGWRPRLGRRVHERRVPLRRAKPRRAGSESLLKVLSGGEPVGVLELDPKRGKEDNCGWISLLYLLPEYRGHNLGVQLIGMASAYFFRKRRGAVRLHVAVSNEHAIGFYRHYGFKDLRVEPGVASDQILMEREL